MTCCGKYLIVTDENLICDICNSIKSDFKFEVVENFSSAFNRQIAECLLIKNSKAQVMNDRDMYNRCIILEIVKEARGLKISKGGPVKQNLKANKILNNSVGGAIDVTDSGNNVTCGLTVNRNDVTCVLTKDKILHDNR